MCSALMSFIEKNQLNMNLIIKGAKVRTLLTEKRISLIKKYLSGKREIWLTFIFAALITLTWSLSNNKRAETPIKEKDDAYDTYIPYGYTLVPIEVQNYESLDSIFGNYGIVSLYFPSDEKNKKPRLLAERVKMLRAPLNQGQFGVLIKDNDAGQIAGHAGPLFVVVHNRETKTNGLIKSPTSKTARFQIVED